MKISLVFATIMVCSALSAQQAPIQDWKKASDLVNHNKHKEAAEVFRGLIGKETGRRVERAKFCYVIALGNSRQFNEALEAAEEIKDPVLKEYALLNAYHGNGKSAALVQKFKDADFTKYPEDLEYKAWYFRGRALGFIRQYERCFAELEKSVSLCADDTAQKLSSLMDLGFFAHEAKKDDIAMSAIEKSIALGKGKYETSVLLLRPRHIQVEILISRKQYDEAEKALAEIKANFTGKTGYFAWWNHILRGDLALARGDKANARESYQKALDIAGNSKPMKTGAQKKIDALTNN